MCVRVVCIERYSRVNCAAAASVAAIANAGWTVRTDRQTLSVCVSRKRERERGEQSARLLCMSVRVCLCVCVC